MLEEYFNLKQEKKELMNIYEILIFIDDSKKKFFKNILFSIILFASIYLSGFLINLSNNHTFVLVLSLGFFTSFYSFSAFILNKNKKIYLVPLVLTTFLLIAFYFGFGFPLQETLTKINYFYLVLSVPLSFITIIFSFVSVSFAILPFLFFQSTGKRKLKEEKEKIININKKEQHLLTSILKSKEDIKNAYDTKRELELIVDEHNFDKEYYLFICEIINKFEDMNRDKIEDLKIDSVFNNKVNKIKNY